jgi:hypothetical protein
MIFIFIEERSAMNISSHLYDAGAVPVLVLSPRYSSDSRVLRQAALQIGWHVERLGGWDVPERLRRCKLIFSGEYSYMKVIAHKLSWALLDADPDWLLHLPAHYTKREIMSMTLTQARTLSQARFIKPATDKLFAAQVYPSGADLPVKSQSLPNELPVLVAEPVCWEVELRFFVLERRVMTFSSYWRGEHPTRLDDGTWEALPEEVEEAQAWINALLADPDVKIPPAIVIDIGKIRDRGWAVIEANAAWAAGIYGCDPRQVLAVIERACVRRDQLSPDEAVWECNVNARRVTRNPG